MFIIQELIEKNKLNINNNANLISEFLHKSSLNIFFKGVDESGENDEQKLQNLIISAEKIHDLDSKEFQEKLEEFLKDYGSLNYEKIKKEQNEFDFYLEKIKEIYNENKKLKQIIELEDEIINELKKREDNYVKSILVLSDNYDDESKKRILKNFFKLGYEKTKESEVKNIKFRNSNVDDLINDIIKKIYSNNTLVNQIVAGEHIFNKLDEIEINNELQGDYTFLVASQIKSVERFIKESILKNLIGEEFINKNNEIYEIAVNKKLDDLRIDGDKVLYCAELGTLDYYLSNCFLEVDNDFKKRKNKIFDSRRLVNNGYSIFYKKNIRSTTKFYKEFVSEVRNGHFHTSLINNINEARYFRKETAFWLLCVICELKGI